MAGWACSPVAGIKRGEVMPPAIEKNWLLCTGVGIIMGGGDIIPEIVWGLITPGMGWNPMAELVMGVKSDCFLGEFCSGVGLPPFIREIK